MGTKVRYYSVIADSDRWDGFEFREGDIIISTPPKCGTTWTQTVCALLIFQTPDFPMAVDQLSPWLDQLLRSRDEVVADLDGQEHRRFIKSHTPLDGLPWDDRVSYICVGRDPRDAAMSWDNHMFNMNMPKLFELREKAHGNEDLAELMKDGMPGAGATPHERFWGWANGDNFQDTSSLAGLMHHVDTFFEVRDKPNVYLLHYGAMKADLGGEMRKLASWLGIDVPEDRWPSLVEAASFESMKNRSAAVAPNATESIWLDQSNFFHKGTNEQWRDVLDDDDLKRYAARVAEIMSPELSDWLHRGPIA